MTGRQWILKQLRDNGFDYKALQNEDHYDQYIYETDSDIKYLSYIKNVRRIFLEIEDAELSVDEELPMEEDYERLISILEDETLRKKKALKFKDLSHIAQKYGFSVDSFFENIPDIEQTLSFIYKSVKTDVKPEIDDHRNKQKIKALQKENNELRKFQANYDELVDLLEEAVQVYEPSDFPIYIEPRAKKKREAVLQFSDSHFGEVITYEDTEGLNEYNPEIAKKRIDKCFTETIEYCKEFGTDILNLRLLGDLVNGEIHQELLDTSAIDTTASILDLSDYLAKWITELSNHFRSIKIQATSGNHGRFHKKPRFKKRNVLNFDYLLYEFIRREVQEIVDEFILPKSFFLFHQTLGFNFLITHGDLFKGGTGLNPISGTIGRDIEKINGVFKHTGRQFQYVEIGHFHTSILDIPSFSGISVIQNGSIKGTDEFSLGAVKSGERPIQNIYVVEEDYGVKFRTPIYLD
jgi:hypothetical protein